MLFGQDRKQIRLMFTDSWNKFQTGQLLSPLEALVADVITMHPEYHALFKAQEEESLDADFDVENGQTNPFLHLGLHIALREQIQAQNPPAVKQVYDKLLQHNPDKHPVEHQMIDCLAQAIWEAQKNQTLPDQTAYIECLFKLC